MTHKIFIFLFALIFSSMAMAQDTAPLIDTTAKQAIVVDYDTGTVLFAKNAEQRMPTSSMSKVITAYVIFDAIKRGEISLTDEYLVSEKAWRMQGSKMFVELGKKIKIEDLLHGVISQSGNDATIVLAEGLAGSEASFADKLNETAQKLGMKDSHFMNASGWPDPDHYSTARDLAILARALISNFPEYYSYYSQKEFTYNNIKQGNRNPLLYKNIGADGIKTGHTEDGGYGLMGSGKAPDGRRVIMVLNGLADDKTRAEESARIMQWAMDRFKSYTIFTASQPVENARLVMAKEQSIPLVLNEDLKLLLPKGTEKQVEVQAEYNEPVVGPVKKGQELGKLVIKIPGMNTVEKPLYAGADSTPLGFFARTTEKAKLFFGHS